MSWTPTRLRYVADLNPPIRADLLQEPSREVSFLAMEAVGEDGSLDLEHTRPVADVRNGYSYFEDGDVAIAKVTPCFENGKGALMRGLDGSAGFGTTELMVLRPRPGVDARFLRYFLGSAQFMAEATGAMTGAGGLKRVPDWFVRDYPVQWPTHGVQERIANFLDEQTVRIDALIAEKLQLLELLREYFDSLLRSVFTEGPKPGAELTRTGIDWLPTIPRTWRLAKFMSVANVVRGASPRPAGDSRFFGGSHIPWVTVAEITKDDAVFLSETASGLTAAGEEFSRKICAGTLVLSNSGATLGVPKILKIDACANDGVVAFERLHPSVGPLYAYYYLRSLTSSLRERIRQGAGQPNLNTTIVKTLPLPIPSLQEQEEIVLTVQGLDERAQELAAHVANHVERLREYRSSLISAAVTGQLDIGAPAEPARLAA